MELSRVRIVIINLILIEKEYIWSKRKEDDLKS